jgi:excisionase family DNA binding protein
MSQEPKPQAGRLLSVESVAQMLSVSVRHVWRLADGGKMPRPIKLGASVRWDRQSLEKWIATGCPPIS